MSYEQRIAASLAFCDCSTGKAEMIAEEADRDIAARDQRIKELEEQLKHLYQQFDDRGEATIEEADLLIIEQLLADRDSDD